MEKLKEIYERLKDTKSDINEHLPTLYKYALEVDSILELGVRGAVSSYALMYGLASNNFDRKIIFYNDIKPCEIGELEYFGRELGIDVKKQWINDLNLKLDRKYELIFIDTWHVYGQLKRELNKFSTLATKYIILHDTMIDADKGEANRLKQNYILLSQISRIPIDEILNGLRPAIEEFLIKNPEWKIKEVFENNNGLTVLERIIKKE